MNSEKNLLLLGSYTYPEFDSVFKTYQYQVTKCSTLRKALSSIKQIKPEIIVAEFVYAPTYGSQLSNFESLFAAAQTFSPKARFIALVDKEDLNHLSKVASHMDICKALVTPVNRTELATYLESIAIDD